MIYIFCNFLFVKVCQSCMQVLKISTRLLYCIGTGQIVMLLTVPGAVNNKYRQPPDSKTSPSRRPQELPDARRRRTSDSDDDEWRHHNSSPYCGKSQAAAAQSQFESRAPNGNEKRWSKRSMEDIDEPAASNVSAHRAAKPAYSRQSSPRPQRDSLVVPVQRRSDERPHSCDAVTTKPILAVDRHHDCSMENVRCFVEGVPRRSRDGGPVVGGRHGCSKEVLPEMQAEDALAAAGRKSVRFAQVVRVCDPTSTITFCNLRLQSASSAPAVLEGGGGRPCSLPALSPCGGLKSVDERVDEVDLPTVVERYMARRRHQHVGDVDLSRSDHVHRFPPLRRRRT